MTYASIESSGTEGRPYFLYQFVEGDQVWRFTSRAMAWTSASSGGATITWEPAAVAHGDVVQTSEIERGRLELTWPLSHPFARRFLGPLGNTPVTLTIFRGHEQVLGETVAHWKGRVVGAEVEGQRILLQAESIFSTLRRAGVRATYQRLCRHALYGRGCGLDIALYWLTSTVTGVSGNGLSVTIPEAAEQPDGWFRSGVLRFGAQLGFIIGHTGATLTLSRPMPELAQALDLAKLTGATLVIAKLDRLSRNAAFLLTLRDSGVRFVACDMPEANDLTVGIMALVAEAEREAISRRTREALAAARARGVKLGNPNGAAALKRAGRGGEPLREAVATNADTFAQTLASVVHAIQAEGHATLRAMAAELDIRGMQTRRGGRWHVSNVRNLMRRLTQ